MLHLWPVKLIIINLTLFHETAYRIDLISTWHFRSNIKVTFVYKIYQKCAWVGGGGKIAPLYRLRLFKPNLVIRIWPVNISKFKYVHPGHFATILRSLGCPGKFWPPWEVVGPPNVCQILTHLGIFDSQSENKYRTPLCFMFICNPKQIEIPKINCIPLLGMAPWVWPLEGSGGAYQRS